MLPEAVSRCTAIVAGLHVNRVFTELDLQRYSPSAPSLLPTPAGTNVNKRGPSLWAILNPCSVTLEDWESKSCQTLKSKRTKMNRKKIDSKSGS